MKVKPFLWLVEVKDPLKIKYPFAMLVWEHEEKRLH
jgi:hypothetical protein